MLTWVSLFPASIPPQAAPMLPQGQLRKTWLHRVCKKPHSRDLLRHHRFFRTMPPTPAPPVKQSPVPPRAHPAGQTSSPRLPSPTPPSSPRLDSISSPRSVCVT